MISLRTSAQVMQTLVLVAQAGHDLLNVILVLMHYNDFRSNNRAGYYIGELIIALGKHSRQLIVSNIEMFPKYRVCLYERKFISRACTYTRASILK